jgi:hypothetical protein
MMEQTTFPANRAVIIGRLGTVRRRGRDTTVAAGRTALRGTVERFALEVASTLGGPFLLELEAGPSTPGRELLESTAAGDRLAVEGELQLRVTVDGRYAGDGGARGTRRRTRGKYGGLA